MVIIINSSRNRNNNNHNKGKLMRGYHTITNIRLTLVMALLTITACCFRSTISLQLDPRRLHRLLLSSHISFLRIIMHSIVMMADRNPPT